MMRINTKLYNRSVIYLIIVSQSLVFSSIAKSETSKDDVNNMIQKANILGFQENKGQMVDINNVPVPHVLFKAEAPGLNIWVTTSGLSYQFFSLDETISSINSSENKKVSWKRVDMNLKNASIQKENILTEGNITQGKINYYLAHCPNGITNVETFSKITIKEIYPGIDWLLYTSDAGTIKHDFIVHPGANPKLVSLIYEGNGSMAIATNQLLFKNGLGNITEGQLLCYQNTELQPINSAYNAIKTNKNGQDNSVFSYAVDFDIDDYDDSKDLVIDPEVVWGTLFGGSLNERINSLETDNSGNVLVTGSTYSINFPTLNVVGAFYQGLAAPGQDIFISKFDNDGKLLWSTYYGGGSNEFAQSIVDDNLGNTWVTGTTFSSNFPLKDPGGAFFKSNLEGNSEAFILKFDINGKRVWATYFGGNGDEVGNTIAIDNNDRAWIIGTTNSTDIGSITQIGHSQPTIGGGKDAFITSFDNFGNQTVFTYYGGEGDDWGNSIAVDINSGKIVITGSTKSLSFPVQQNEGPYVQDTSGGGKDGFIAEFSPAFWLNFCAYFGGDGDDVGETVAFDNSGNFWLTGFTESTNFPLQDVGTFFQGTKSGVSDAFISKFDYWGVLEWSTYYGGSAVEGAAASTFDNMVIDNCGNVNITFETGSVDIKTYASVNSIYNDSTFSGDAYDCFSTLR